MTDRVLIVNGLVLADAANPAAPADVLIEGGFIRDCGPPGQFDALAGVTRIDAGDRLVIPAPTGRWASARWSRR